MVLRLGKSSPLAHIRTTSVCCEKKPTAWLTVPSACFLHEANLSSSQSFPIARSDQLEISKRPCSTTAVEPPPPPTHTHTHFPSFTSSFYLPFRQLALPDLVISIFSYPPPVLSLHYSFLPLPLSPPALERVLAFLLRGQVSLMLCGAFSPDRCWMFSAGAVVQ